MQTSASAPTPVAPASSSGVSFQTALTNASATTNSPTPNGQNVAGSGPASQSAQQQQQAAIVAGDGSTPTAVPASTGNTATRENALVGQANSPSPDNGASESFAKFVAARFAISAQGPSQQPLASQLTANPAKRSAIKDSNPATPAAEPVGGAVQPAAPAVATGVQDAAAAIAAQAAGGSVPPTVLPVAGAPVSDGNQPSAPTPIAWDREPGSAIVAQAVAGSNPPAVLPVSGAPVSDGDADSSQSTGNLAQQQDAGAVDGQLQPATSANAANAQDSAGAQEIRAVIAAQVTGGFNPPVVPPAAGGPQNDGNGSSSQSAAKATQRQAIGVVGSDLQPSAPVTSAGAQVAGTSVAAQAAVGFNPPAVLPAASAPLSIEIGAANGSGSSSQSGKATQRQVAGAIGQKTSGPGDTTDAGQSKSAQTVSGSGDASSHGAQNSGQSTQSSLSSQPDPSQVAVAAAKAVDSGVSQALPLATQGVSHDAGTAAGTPQGGGDTTGQTHQTVDAASKQSDVDEAVTPSSINASNLMQTMGDTQMRVGMHSSEFGDISIRTTVSQQQMTAQISLDHAGLSQAISSHVASVQSKIGNDYGLHASIEVNSQGGSSSSQSGQPGQSGQSQPREQKAFMSSVQAESTTVPIEADVGLSSGALVSASNGYRLDIRA